MDEYNHEAIATCVLMSRSLINYYFDVNIDRW